LANPALPLAESFFQSVTTFAATFFATAIGISLIGLWVAKKHFPHSRETRRSVATAFRVMGLIVGLFAAAAI
jgi:low temperature requirement protein LtrA